MDRSWTHGAICATSCTLPLEQVMAGHRCEPGVDLPRLAGTDPIDCGLVRREIDPPDQSLIRDRSFEVTWRNWVVMR